MGSYYEACTLSGDVFISFTIIATLVTFFWRGTWDMLDAFLIPTNYALSLWVSFVGGSFLHMILAILQNTLNVTFTPEKLSSFGFCVVSRLHAYLAAFLQVCQWRGFWGLLDIYGIANWITLLLPILVLSVLGSMSQTTGPPLAVVHDLDQQDYFTVAPIIDTDCRPGWLAILSGASFYVLLITNLGIAYWRGVWSVLDVHVFPEDLVRSAAFSLALSIFLALPILTGEQYIREFCRNKYRNRIVRTFVEKAYITVASLVAINHWRGVWYIQISFLLPDNPHMSAIISHFVGIAGLMTLFVSRTAAGVNSFDDRDIYGGKPGLFTLAYTSRICKLKDDNSSYIVPVSV
ncbi:uncharacterized protein LOC117314729 [Pecten maximus]|uniref:uncharacterized protein LOC117314729 n=1 Tax=Pecten maximus TaxID=6579 RepID=UPI001458238B|nr:uncharacterized protein LOC117314729 [Pecten maximus]